MALNIQVLSDNRLYPTVFNIVQGSNKVDTVVYTLENYIVGERDLSTYDWYVNLIGVEGVDIVKLTSAIVDGKLQVTFDLTEYVTRLGNTLTYQLVAKDNTSAVWNSAKGVILNAESIPADDKVVAEYASILRQWELRLQDMAGALDTAIYYIAYNETLPKEKRVAGRLYYQYLYAENKNGQLEDSNGNILIPEQVAKNIGITAIDGLTAGTVQEALVALKELIENKDSLPAQAGNAGKYLRTNGDEAEWAEVEALPEQDGQDGKFLKTVNGKAVWEDVPRGLPLLSSIWADHKLNDASYLRADTFSWQSGDVYKAAYEHLVADCENAQTTTYYAWTGEGFILGTQETVYTTSQTPAVGDAVYMYSDGDIYATTAGTITSSSSASIAFKYAVDGTTRSAFAYSGEVQLPIHLETIAGVTINYCLSQDGHKITMNEAAVMAIYEATGVAWYYLLDTVNKQFKLPRTKWGFTGLRDSVGGYVEPGLPNITGYLGSNVMVGSNATGAFKAANTVSSSAYDSSNHSKTASDASFDASRSNAAYGNSDTVQPPATQMYLYFYVGNYVRGLDEINAGVWSEMINDGDAQAIVDEINAAKEEALAEINESSLAGLQDQIDQLQAELNIMLGRMDFSNSESVSIKSSATYTCPGDGYIQFVGVGQTSSLCVTINGADFCSYTAISNGTINLVPVSQGDVIGASSLSAVVNMLFIPQKQ